MFNIPDNNNNRRRNAEITRSRRDDNNEDPVTRFYGFPNAPCPTNLRPDHVAVGSPLSAARLPNNGGSRFSPDVGGGGGDLYSAPFRGDHHYSSSANNAAKLWMDPESSSFAVDPWGVDDLGGLAGDFSRMNLVDGTKNRGSYDVDPYACSFDASVSVLPCFNETGAAFCNGGGVRTPFVEKGFAFEPSLGEDHHVYHHFMEQRMKQGTTGGGADRFVVEKGFAFEPSSVDHVYQKQPPFVNPYAFDRFVGPTMQHFGMEMEYESAAKNHPFRFSSQIMHPNSTTAPSHYFPARRETAAAAAATELPHGRLSPVRGGGVVDNSFIIQGKEALKPCGVENGYGSLRGFKKSPCGGVPIHARGGGGLGSRDSSYSLPLMLNFYSLAEAQGYIYSMAKDQNGCRFLQSRVEDGSYEDRRMVYEGIIDNVVELMIDPFGNYLVQKLLEVCTEEQRLQIVLMLTKEPGHLVRISLNTHGTRVVQKLIETLNSSKQISLVKSAIQPGFLELIKDLNGNHVIQRCLQCFSCQDNEFIFEAGVKFCAEIATHRHGCCVLQRCIDHSVGKHRDKLIMEICKHGLLLAQDPFGNYVVQYIIEMEIPAASAKMMSQLKGHYVNLSTQKFSSHVVEKCLRHIPDSRSRIVKELTTVQHFEHLLQDPYANYVIQCALAVTKGPLHASLVESIRLYKMLRSSPYCKRIFSGSLLKK